MVQRFKTVLQNNVQGNEVHKTSISGLEPVRAFTFRSIVQHGTTEPVTVSAETTAIPCNLFDTLT